MAQFIRSITVFLAIIPFEGCALLLSHWWKCRQPNLSAVSMIPDNRQRPSDVINIDIASDEDISPTLTKKVMATAYQKPRQTRRIPTRRKPRNYWQSTSNLRDELYLFWTENNVPLEKLNPSQPPPIPSEYILNFFQRNDLRGAIASNGGREHVSYLLDGAKVIPGRWKDAIEMEEVKCLLPLMTSDLSLNEQTQAPLGDNILLESKNTIEQFQLIEIAQQQQNLTSGNNNATIEREKEFWTKEKAVLMLYHYLENYKKYKQRPSVWMPQLVELSHEGYSKLFNAASRFKKLPCVSVFSTFDEENKCIEDMAGLVPYNEWRFFDSQLQLFVELKNYLNLYHNGSEDVFPDPLDVKTNHHTNLYHLIRIHGGKVLLAQKLSMKLYRGEIKDGSSIDWGPITLDFIIRLLHFIRSEFMTMSPPLNYPIISMPLEQDFHRRGQDNLASLVIVFGGYENIARRLGLAYFDGKNLRMDKMAFKGAQYLWKHRNANNTATVITKPSSKVISTDKRKRKGVAWTKDIVVEELHAYVKVNMTKRSLPAVWMPRFVQFDEDGRTDLKNAISRNGGQMRICETAGLIPYSVWKRFELFRELVKELLKFNNHGMLSKSDIDENSFTVPAPADLTEREHERLSELLRTFGGTNTVEDLLFVNGRHLVENLSLLVELTEYMHSDMMSKEPPFSHEILMPTKDQLLDDKRDDLVAGIRNYGGFELVANIIPECIITQLT